MLTRLIIVRHAQAEGNISRHFHGWTDSNLTDLGHIQAELAAKKLADMPIDVIYSSTLKRALQTAEHIARIKNLEIIKMEELKEINGGDWEGQLFAVLPKKWPVEYDNWENKPHIHCMPNGESMAEFQERLIKGINLILSENEGKNICIVTHGTSIKALLCYFKTCNLDEMSNILWYDNTAITVVDFDGSKFDIKVEGDASHLGKEYSTVQNQSWWTGYIKSMEKKKEKGK